MQYATQTQEGNNHENRPNTRIYVACLASYNAGILYGAWINADQEPEAIAEEVSAILAASPTL